MKGAEFLTKETNHKDIFTYEDFSEENVMMYMATKQFIEQEILPKTDDIEKQKTLFQVQLDEYFEGQPKMLVFDMNDKYVAVVSANSIAIYSLEIETLGKLV